MGEPRAFWMNDAPNSVVSGWPAVCRAGGIRVREIFGDEFCTYQPPDPAVTGADTGERQGIPLIHFSAYPEPVSPRCHSQKVLTLG